MHHRFGESGLGKFSCMTLVRSVRTLIARLEKKEEERRRSRRIAASPQRLGGIAGRTSNVRPVVHQEQAVG